MSRLDEFESELYKRVTETVQIDEKLAKIDVYVWNHDLNWLVEADWDYKDFLKRLPDWNALNSEADL